MILGKTLGEVEIDEAPDGGIAMHKIEENRFDLVLLDISMPGKSGFEVLKELLQMDGAPLVIMLSVSSQVACARRSLELGASAYLVKDTLADELGRAISVALDGGRYLSGPIAEDVLAPKQDPLV